MIAGLSTVYFTVKLCNLDIKIIRCGTTISFVDFKLFRKKTLNRKYHENC